MLGVFGMGNGRHRNGRGRDLLQQFVQIRESLGAEFIGNRRSGFGVEIVNTHKPNLRHLAVKPRMQPAHSPATNDGNRKRTKEWKPAD